MNTLIQQLNLRYATKQYDSTKKISSEDLDVLKESIRLAPTSYGIQPYKVFVIETAELRQQLREKSWNQPQITDASHLFVFAAKNVTGAVEIDEYIELIAATRGASVADLKGFSDYMKGATAHLTEEQQLIWNAKQAYIGLGMLLTAAASLNVDSTPMEGFDAMGYKEVLGLTDYTPVVVAAIGYRSSEDKTQHNVKVRKSTETFFEIR